MQHLTRPHKVERRQLLTRRLVGVAFVAALCLATVATATADPIAITGGTIWATEEQGSGPASFTGVPSFSFAGQVVPAEGRIDPFICSPICFPGSTISGDALLSGTALPGVATYKGNIYPEVGGLSSPALLLLEFSAGTITVPALTGFTTLVTVPFTVNRGVFITDPLGAQIRFHAITGQGVESVLFRNPNFLGAWAVDQVKYDFSQSAPVPEPATLGTLAFGLAALARTAHKRRSRRS